MNPWLLASIVLAGGLMLCALACLRCEPAAALAALTVATSVGVVLMVTLTEAFGRQPFMDLAVVLGPIGLAGSLAFVRFLERRE